MAFDRTTSQVLFDNGTHKCISFTSLAKGEGVQANQFLILDNERAAVLDPGGDLTYVPLTMELNKYTRLTNLDMSWPHTKTPILLPRCHVGWFIPKLKWWHLNCGHAFYRI